MREKLYTVGFTLVVTAVLVGAVSLLNHVLADRIDQNRKVARFRAVLEAMGVKTPDELAGMEAGAVVDLLERSAEEKTLEWRGATRTYYAFADRADAYCFPIRGMGYWGEIRGYLAVDTADRTILGVSFTDHSETPGLGAKIDEETFKSRFRGQPYRAEPVDGMRLDFVPEGSADDGAPEVDAISGATETSRRVETFLNADLGAFLSTLETPKGDSP